MNLSSVLNSLGKRQGCSGCCGRIWLAGSNSPGMMSVSTLEASCTSRLSSTPTASIEEALLS